MEQSGYTWSYIYQGYVDSRPKPIMRIKTRIRSDTRQQPHRSGRQWENQQGENLKARWTTQEIDSRDEHLNSSDTWKRRFLVPTVSVSETILAFVPQAGSVLTSKAEQILKWLPESLEEMCPLLTIRSHLKAFPSSSRCFKFIAFFLPFGFSKLFPIPGLCNCSSFHSSHDWCHLSICRTRYLLRKAFPYHSTKVTLRVALAFYSIVLS